jgi:hypothetical protein
MQCETHRLASASMTLEHSSGRSGGRTAGTLKLCYTCRCGRTFDTQSTFVFGSRDELQAMMEACTNAVFLACTQAATLEPSQPYSSG